MPRRAALATEERECGGGGASSYAELALRPTQYGITGPGIAQCGFKGHGTIQRGVAAGDVARHCVS